MSQEEEQRFVDASVSEKQSILLDQGTSAAMADKYLSLCERSTVDCTNVANDDVANKVDVLCTGTCKVIKDEAINNANEAEVESDKMFDQQIDKTNEKILALTKSSDTLIELGKVAQQWREEMHRPKKIKAMLHAKIDKAVADMTRVSY